MNEKVTMRQPAVSSLLVLSALLVGCKGTGTPTDVPTPTATPVPTPTPTPTECTEEHQFDSWSVTDTRVLIKACSPYIIDSDMDISGGGSLTIEPGVELQFASDHWLSVQDGTLVAEGTVEEPVVFTSQEAAPTPGSWLGLRFNQDALNGSVLRNAVVSYAGQDAYSQKGCIMVDDDRTAVALENVTLEACGQGGLYVSTEDFLDATGLVFRDIDGFGMSLSPASMGGVDEVFTYENVTHNAIQGGQVEQTATWIDQGVPYEVDGSLEVGSDDDPMLTLEAGLTLQFEPSEWLQVGSSNGGLVVNGTPTAPVVLESSETSPTAGSWLGLHIEGDVLAGTELTGLHVRHAGEDAYGTAGCVTIDGDHAGRVAVTDSTFEACGLAGLSARDIDFTFASFTGNTFVDVPFGWDLRPGAVAAVDASQTYTNTPKNRIDGAVLAASGTWIAQGIPTEVFDSIEVEGDDDPVLTLEAGVHLQFETSEWLQVGSGAGGGLITNGTSTDPVVLESSAALPTSGDWLGLSFGSETLNGSEQTHLVVRHAGEDAYGQGGCVTIDTDQPGRIGFTDSMFEDCGQAGVTANDASFTFGAFTGNTFVRSPYGLHVRPNALGSVPAMQTYTDTPANRIAGDVVDMSQTWVDQGVPFDVFGDIEVEGDSDPVLTLEAGVELLFESSQWLQIGGGDDGGLVVNGTSTDRVVFGSQEALPTAGSWLGLHFDSNTLAGTSLSFAHVQHAGEDSYGQEAGITLDDVGTSVTIADTTFLENLNYDVWCGGSSAPTLTGLGMASVFCPI